MTATGAAMVSHTVDGGIAWITLDGEATRNALDSTSADRLVAACDAIDADRTVGVAIIIGANRTFCSGAVREVLFSLAGEPAHVAYEELSRLYRSFQRVGRLTVPSVAAIDGAAVGAGLNLALAADVRIATAQSRLISGFAQIGIHPGGGHLHLLSRLGGREAAAAMGLFAHTLSGSEAKAKGLVWDAVPAEDLISSVVAASAQLSADPELARAVKTSLNLTTTSLDAWSAATEVERARQLWSLTRTRPHDPALIAEGSS